MSGKTLGAARAGGSSAERAVRAARAAVRHAPLGPREPGA